MRSSSFLSFSFHLFFHCVLYNKSRNKYDPRSMPLSNTNPPFCPDPPKIEINVARRCVQLAHRFEDKKEVKCTDMGARRTWTRRLHDSVWTLTWNGLICSMVV